MRIVHHRKRHFILAALFSVVFVVLIYLAYNDVKKQVLEDSYAQQDLMADQAAKAIQGYFDSQIEKLQILTRIPGIIQMDSSARALFQATLSTGENWIMAITRMTPDGRISYTWPHVPSAIGQDITYQDHVAKVMKVKRPVISDVFEAVQGYQAIAIHVPILRDGRFQGSVALLLSFDAIARKFLDPIRFGDCGYAWVISEQGVELYCVHEDHIGRSVFDNVAGFPDLLAMVGKMMDHGSGHWSYYYDRSLKCNSRVMRKHAVFRPIDLEDTFWSIAICTPEKEILATISGFRWRMFIITVVGLLVGLLFLYSIIRAWNLYRSEQERREAEEALRVSEERFRLAFFTSPDAVAINRVEDGLYTEINQGYSQITGYTEQDLIGQTSVSVDIWVNPEDREKLVAVLKEQGVCRNLEAPFRMKDGTIRNGMMSAAIIMLNDEPHILSITRDVTDRLQTMTKLAESVREKEILLTEIHHRTKNNMAVISSMTNMMATGAECDETIDALQAIKHRIMAMSLVHEQLYLRDQLATVDMDDYVRQLWKNLYASYLPDGVSLELEVDCSDLVLPVTVAIPLGLILNEALTNSYKYAYHAGERGVISIDLSTDDTGMVNLIIADDGCGFDSKAAKQGRISLGLELIQHIAVDQLGGEIDIQSREGTRISIKFNPDS